MELGSNSPMIIMPDADLEKVAQATVTSGFSNAGQVCISAQRVLVDGKVYGEFLDVLKPQVEGIKAGNGLGQGVQMGPMIRESDAIRVSDWIGGGGWRSAAPHRRRPLRHDAHSHCGG